MSNTPKKTTHDIIICDYLKYLQLCSIFMSEVEEYAKDRRDPHLLDLVKSYIDDFAACSDQIHTKMKDFISPPTNRKDTP